MQEVLCESWGKKELYAEGAEIAEDAEKKNVLFGWGLNATLDGGGQGKDCDAGSNNSEGGKSKMKVGKTCQDSSEPSEGPENEDCKD